MKNYFYFIFAAAFLLCSVQNVSAQLRTKENFNKNWHFSLGDAKGAEQPGFNDSKWRTLNLPHDWSIEGKFSKDNPATPGGGALPGGIGWYRKTFSLSDNDKSKLIFIDFDGVYRNSEVWINGRYLGKRPYGYSSFRYELTPFLKYGSQKNIIAVKVDNSKQPNSRWYSGSGIYRNVHLVKTNKVYVDHWGTFITTPKVEKNNAEVNISTNVKNVENREADVILSTVIFDKEGKKVTEILAGHKIPAGEVYQFNQYAQITNPALWSIESPYLYKAVSSVRVGGAVSDEYATNFGIRTFAFDTLKGFILNGQQVKIKGVCNHHDLGCLGAAVNKRAIERQLGIMKDMGVNSIRTSHNPPAPELLELCDQMGFLVMDEAFDMWKINKTEFDYALDWDQWHKQDLTDMILRDRNHPSVFIWSIGNEVAEQWQQSDSLAIVIARELASIVKNLDTTRPITSACNRPAAVNPVIKSGALDLLGENYNIEMYESFPEQFPGKLFIASETTSALATRGHYDMPSDSIRIWPLRWDLPFTTGNPDNTCSSYDNCRVPWGSTHEQTWAIIKKHDFLSGMYVWTGFDYLGEPTPYLWPSRSSYFGIVDLAGFPKDAFYFYQSQWTTKPVLHIFPHWNWKQGDTVDVWAFTNCDQVELFLNGKSMGMKKITPDIMHLVWRLQFTPGTLKAVGYKGGKEILVSEIKTAGVPAKIVLEPDRNKISADGEDLSFVTVKVLDKDGNLIPNADNMINFSLSGEGKIAGVDNGLQTSMEPFKANYRKAFNGLCLAVIQSTGKTGTITLTAASEGLEKSVVKIETVK